MRKYQLSLDGCPILLCISNCSSNGFKNGNKKLSKEFVYLTSEGKRLLELNKKSQISGMYSLLDKVFNDGNRKLVPIDSLNGLKSKLEKLKEEDIVKTAQYIPLRSSLEWY